MKLWMQWEASTQPLNAAKGGSKTTMDRLFSDSALLIPAKLHEAALREGFRPERRTAIYLIYDLIVRKCTQMKAEWAFISDRSFLKVVKNHTRKSTEKKWLEENGFIQIKKWRSDNGTLKNSKIPGKQCQGYRLVVQEGECIWVDLWKRKLCWQTCTEDDPFCQFTRMVLGKVAVDDSTATRMCLGEADYSSLPVARRMAIVHWARTLQLGHGSIRRGRRVNRLFSPWTSAPRELRKACFLANESIVSLDLQASQPTLIGLLAEDDAFSEACLNDELYGYIGTVFSVEREEAKRIFLSYIYGPNRKPGARNKQAFFVQEYVAQRFPKTHAYVWNSKDRDYKAFARQLQNIEAKLFVEGILAEMKQNGVPALTAHDSVAVPETHYEQAVEACRKILGERLKGKGRIKATNYKTMGTEAIAI